MSEQDPVRWLNDPDAPGGLSDMLRAAQDVRPSIAQRAELGVKVGVAGSGIWAASALKGAIAATLIAGGALVYVNSGSNPAAPASVASNTSAAAIVDRAAEPEAPAEAPGAEDAMAAQSATDMAPQPEALDEKEAAPKAPTTLASTSKREGSANPSEAQLLAAARGLIESQPSRALQLLARHEALYPSGLLAQEREVLRVRALKQAGKLEQAAREADEFKKNHPESAHSL